MSKALKYCLIALCVAGLVSVRAFLEPLFYDPLHSYFQSDYLSLGFPSVENWKYFFHVFLRFGINTILSIAVIYLFFENKESLIFLLKLYVISFLILIFIFFEELIVNASNGYLLLFYVRRLLIHPIILIILLPAFYFQQQSISNKS